MEAVWSAQLHPSWWGEKSTVTIAQILMCPYKKESNFLGQWYWVCIHPICHGCADLLRLQEDVSNSIGDVMHLVDYTEYFFFSVDLDFHLFCRNFVNILSSL